jgi:hypothetical protein
MIDYSLPHLRVISRKDRLYCCACVRRVWYRLKNEEAGRWAVEVAEEFADGQRTTRDLADARDAALAAAAAWDGCRSEEGQRVREALLAAAECAIPENRGSCDVATNVGWQAVRASRESEEAERATQRARSLDIFGPPDRTSAFLPEWQTEAVVSLARRMYETRDFDAMPELADALHAAGCADAALLEHCRGPGPRHVRGCWVVDLLLERE